MFGSFLHRPPAIDRQRLHAAASAMLILIQPAASDATRCVAEPLINYSAIFSGWLDVIADYMDFVVVRVIVRWSRVVLAQLMTLVLRVNSATDKQGCLFSDSLISFIACLLLFYERLSHTICEVVCLFRTALPEQAQFMGCCLV